MTSPANDIPNSEIWSSAPTVVEILGEEKYLELEAENNLKMFLPIWMPIFEADLIDGAPFSSRWAIDVLTSDEASFVERYQHFCYLIDKHYDWQAEQRLRRIEAALNIHVTVSHVRVLPSADLIASLPGQGRTKKPTFWRELFQLHALHTWREVVTDEQLSEMVGVSPQRIASAKRDYYPKT